MKFEFPVSWGLDLQSEHERYLVERHFKKPVILINYPKEIKAFYMKQNDDGKTVRAMDVLVPEDRRDHRRVAARGEPDKLRRRIEEVGVPEKDILVVPIPADGEAPHSGFGLGSSAAAVQTGMGNIRDVIPSLDAEERGVLVR